MDHFRRIHEAHDRGGLSSAAVAQNVPHSGGYLVRSGMVVGGGHRIGEQIGTFPICLSVVKGLVMGQWRG